jgi:hypothetical protein
MILLKFLHILFNTLRIGSMIILIAAILFIAYRGNQPMSVPGAPAGITYWQFMADRIEAAKEIKPARCGYGMFSFLILVGPFYSGLYTYVGIRPDSFLARVTQRDSSIPNGVAGAAWHQVPEIWWKVVERLSWSALTKHGPGCRFRPVRVK